MSSCTFPVAHLLGQSTIGRRLSSSVPLPQDNSTSVRGPQALVQPSSNEIAVLVFWQVRKGMNREVRTGHQRGRRGEDGTTVEE